MLLRWSIEKEFQDLFHDEKELLIGKLKQYKIKNEDTIIVVSDFIHYLHPVRVCLITSLLYQQIIKFIF